MLSQWFLAGKVVSRDSAIRRLGFYCKSASLKSPASYILLGSNTFKFFMKEKLIDSMSRGFLSCFCFLEGNIFLQRNPVSSNGGRVSCFINGSFERGLEHLQFTSAQPFSLGLTCREHVYWLFLAIQWAQAWWPSHHWGACSCWPQPVTSVTCLQIDTSFSCISFLSNKGGCGVGIVPLSPSFKSCLF